MSASSIMWKIKSLNKAFGNRVYSIDKVTTMGRSVDNDITINTTHLSREHLKLTPTATGLWLEDLGSKNGTFVKGVKVIRSVLRHGDRFSVDVMEFQVFNLGESADVDEDKTLVRSSVNLRRPKKEMPSTPASVEVKKQRINEIKNTLLNNEDANLDIDNQSRSFALIATLNFLFLICIYVYIYYIWTY